MGVRSTSLIVIFQFLSLDLTNIYLTFSTQEKSLIGHCERGCRFFYLIQTANLQELNTSSSTLLCVECKSWQCSYLI